MIDPKRPDRKNGVAGGGGSSGVRPTTGRSGPTFAVDPSCAGRPRRCRGSHRVAQGRPLRQRQVPTTARLGPTEFDDSRVQIGGLPAPAGRRRSAISANHRGVGQLGAADRGSRGADSAERSKRRPKCAGRAPDARARERRTSRRAARFVDTNDVGAVRAARSPRLRHQRLVREARRTMCRLRFTASSI